MYGGHYEVKGPEGSPALVPPQGLRGAAWRPEEEPLDVDVLHVVKCEVEPVVDQRGEGHLIG